MIDCAVPRVMISGASSRCGTTLLVWGMIEQLKKKGLAVAACEIGPELQRAVELRRLTGRYSACLDPFCMSTEQLRSQLYLSGLGADIVILSSNESLYKSTSFGTLDNSPAEIASQLGAPIVLIADSRGFDNSIAALIHGYSTFSDSSNLSGVILNRFSGTPAEAEALRFGFEHISFPKLIGAAPHIKAGAVKVPSGACEKQNMILFPREFIVDLCGLVANYVDLDKLIEIASSCAVISGVQMSDPECAKTKIAVSEDVCFALTYQNNLDILRYYGAQLVPFSPLADEELPHGIGGIYLSGCFLRNYAEDLENNYRMQQAIQEFVSSGGVVYAEGASSAFCCDEYRLPGVSRTFKGLGLINGCASATEQAEQPVELEIMENSILGRAGSRIKGLMADRWTLNSNSEAVLPLLRSTGHSPRWVGYAVSGNVIAQHGFLNFSSNPQSAISFIEAAANCVSF